LNRCRRGGGHYCYSDEASKACITALIKRKSNFPQIQGNSEWSSCKVIQYVRKGFLINIRKFANIFSYMRRPLVIYDFATALF
jgi:hypothetical protein